MKTKDFKVFKKVIKKEINDLEEVKAFELISLFKNLKDRRLICFISSFNRKRTPLGI